VLGANPNVHCIVAPIQTCIGIFAPPFASIECTDFLRQSAEKNYDPEVKPQLIFSIKAGMEGLEIA
jgi:hypothetical protein